MTRAMAARQRWVAGLALLLTLSCEQSREREVTPWLKVRATRPTVDWPHILVTGRVRETVLVRRGGSWTPAGDAYSLDAVPVDGGGVFVVFFNSYAPARLFRSAEEDPVELDRATCSLGRVSPDGKRIVCADCAGDTPSPDGGCLEGRLTEIDPGGKVIGVVPLPQVATLPSCLSLGPFVAGFRSDGSVLVTMHDTCDGGASCRLFSASASGAVLLASSLGAARPQDCERLSDWKGVLPDLDARPPRAPVSP